MEDICGSTSCFSKSFSLVILVISCQLLFSLVFPHIMRMSLLPLNSCTTNVAIPDCLWEFGSGVVLFSAACSSPLQPSSSLGHHGVQQRCQFIRLHYFWLFLHHQKISRVPGGEKASCRRKKKSRCVLDRVFFLSSVAVLSVPLPFVSFPLCVLAMPQFYFHAFLNSGHSDNIVDILFTRHIE